MGPVHLSDSRESVVARLVDMLRQAHGRGAEFVTFPELALTHFLPALLDDRGGSPRALLRAQHARPGDAAALRRGAQARRGFLPRLCGAHRGRPRLQLGGDRRARRQHRGPLPQDPSAGPFGAQARGALPASREEVLRGRRPGLPRLRHRRRAHGHVPVQRPRWPETYRVMALQGAEVVVLGYNTPSLNIHWNEPAHLRTTTHLISLQANAYQNGIWVAAAAKCGSEDGHHMIGSSVIVAPTGEIVARAVSEEDEVICVRADLRSARTSASTSSTSPSTAARSTTA
ncbi:carbon-nitrogen hydrolase domain-containing protein [Ditylenchus destructor]|uniref:Carbon-nitrogen hydrolase domain-containing protein n=1 Tax=Ditylenchus destructor TaxID=166010 RepID=A0AAD4QVU3_9BILA|nr:carbon-nitrogen hydrolase domain-containing protein [Ditylenchus destructor]